LKWEVMGHPAHIPDLVPSDFHLFGPLKEAWFWRDDVKNRVHQWLVHNQKLSVMMALSSW
jgi:hypothetical protein